MQKKSFPDFVPAMMALSVKEPFDSSDWIFEPKLDGYRAITVFDAAGKPNIWSRNGLPPEQKFPAISQSVSRLKLRSSVLDAEIIAVLPEWP
jgi:bifunctional non-homologous end joining protein LigD